MPGSTGCFSVPFFPEATTKLSQHLMEKFTTRVQLNGRPTAEDYEHLHQAMKRRGFSRIIESDNGTKFWLPHAEYNRVSSAKRSQILRDAQEAAASVSSDFQVLVTESAGRTWHGLKAATPAEAVAN